MYSFIVALCLIALSQGANICNLRSTTNPSGDVNSPNWPSNYPVSQNCPFTIRVPAGNSIVISFKAMDLESEEDEESCYDYVEITDLVSKEKKMYCGKKLPQDYTSKSNQVEITFASDHSDPDPKPKGFRLTYSTKRNIQATSVCPGQEFIAKKEGGYLSSPNYPLNYGNNMNCKFTLLVPTGKKTHIEFVELNIEYNSKCQYDRLNVSSNDQSSSRTVCGAGQAPGSIHKGSKVYFHFVTNGRTTKKGFLIKYYFTDDESFTNDCVCPQGRSYIRVDLTKKKLIRESDDIHFEFKTTQASSLLLYAMGRHRDFIRVKLVRGNIKFSVDLGTGVGSITVPTPRLNDNRWHKVEVKRNGRRVEVSIDNGMASGILNTPGIFSKLDLRPPNAIMYVAGSPRGHGPTFVGCLKNFVVDKRTPIVDALKGDPAHTIYFSPFPRCSAA